ncbi:response regulator [Pedobacter sp. HMF7647]|uniref:Response regulator n=1 Tax=Hufsiella arboris TaxID=2695275 RepID=A0A7K1Y7R2_9SPHI|nr:sigma-54 dependent transcriptional regulator [Hufsiella arboris]MXV50596.1 response regulator [Hufsiella arboris]
MNKKILIVEDEFIEANNLKMILEKAGYSVCTIARSVEIAVEIVDREKPDLVLLDIFLKGRLTGIDLAKVLREKNIAFVFLSANSNKKTLTDAKATQPYGFLVKPFRERDVLIMLDIAHQLHEQRMQLRKQEVALVKEETSSKNDCTRSIIGNSSSLKAALDYVKIVSPTETTVLILGESGTGKERIADCIHASSDRKDRAFIKVNCAALPASLIESELFGHEKGAFTGAVDRRIGKFEQAQGGTIFLDEIGELPAELQAKLLRVLQEKEIERLGGRGTIKINVRIITATNRSLEKEVTEGRFRMDLYYRLNVFPIIIPPLRDRKEDIPQLVNYYVDRFSGKFGKKINGLSAKAMNALVTYHWPGNVRELENLIERTVLLTLGTTIENVEIPTMKDERTVQSLKEPMRIKTIEENEIDHIKEVLKICKGKISGPGGAAEILNLPYSTLTSRIKKLGIRKEMLFK